MNRKILALTISALAITSCKAPQAVDQGSSLDGISIAGEKSKPINDGCFYKSKKPSLPADTKNIEFQYVVIDNIGKPQLRRLRPRSAGSPAQTALFRNFQDHQDNSDWDAWFKLLPSLQTAELIPTRLAVPPLIPNRKAGVRGLPSTAPNPYQPVNPGFARNPSALDFIMYKHSRVSIVLSDSGYKFDEERPIEVYSGSGKNLSPFYLNENLVTLNSDGNILTFEFFTDEKKIPMNLDCVYDYQLNVISETIGDDGTVFRTKITIDPGGGRGRP